jgi:putative PEP-CTERM system histidine kinase
MVSGNPEPMMLDLALVAHALTALAYIALALTVILRSELSLASLWLTLACLVTAVWAGLAVFGVRFDGFYSTLVSPAETLKTASFAGLLVVLLYPSWKLREHAHYTFVLAIGLGFLFALQFAVDAIGWLGLMDTYGSAAETALLSWLPRLATAVGGLLLVENVYRNASTGYRWRIRMLVIGVGTLFAFDIFLYSGPAISGRIAEGALSARALIHLIIAPLLYVAVRRNSKWTSDFQVSRKVVFHSVTLIGVGLYLLSTSAIAFGLRVFGGAWGISLQIAAVAGFLVGLLVIAGSAQARSWLKVKLLKHFFAYRYDYREEWLRLIGTIGQPGKTAEPLEKRITRAITDLLESGGGSLWLADDIGDYVYVDGIGATKPQASRLEAHEPIIAYMRDRQRIINLDDLRNGHDEYGGASMPEWLRTMASAWIIVPLIHLERLVAFVCVDKPMVARQLNWEDFDLLKTVGRQTGSYLAEQTTQRAMIEAARFDDFNRRFAFIVHDIKNLVSQLSLVSRNAEKHADNPEFRADMNETLRNSVAKMNELLARLREHHGAVEPPEQLDVVSLLERIVTQKQKSHRMLNLRSDSAVPSIAAPRERLAQVFGHLIQNAIEASGPDAPIEVSVSARAGFLDVHVDDHGCGMSDAFVRHELFKPFSSTKAAGYGIGAYEAREIVRSLKGTIHVRSVLGEGTQFIVRLPLAADVPPEVAA